jgi:hypothetical protein
MKKNLLLFATTALVVLGSCSQNDTTASGGAGSELKVKTTGITARAGEKTAWAANDEIGIFVTGTGYTPVVTNYKTTDGTIWAFSTAPISLTGNPASVYAVYPAATALSVTTPATALDATSTFTTSAPATDDFAASGATDYMWGTGTAVSNATGNNTSTVTMHHALAKLSFIVVKSANYPTGTTAGKINAITLTSAGSEIVTSGTVKISDGTFTAGTPTVASLAYSLSTAININEVGATAKTAYMLVCPNTAFTTGDLTFSVTVDGKTMPISGLTAVPSWAGGNNYTYTITISPAGLAVVSPVTITPWTEGTGGSLTAN